MVFQTLTWFNQFTAHHLHVSKCAQNICPREAERMSDVEVVEDEDCNSSEMTGSSKVGGQGGGVKVANFHQWKYSHYFVVIDESEKNMRARCTLCSRHYHVLGTRHQILKNI